MVDQPHDGDEEDLVPPIDFTTFVLSLSTSAITHLEHARTTPNEARVVLALARQAIDLIALLEQKTTGNLTGEEERLIGQVLVDLRMRYVAQCKA
jgi:hypothetical protein